MRRLGCMPAAAAAVAALIGAWQIAASTGAIADALSLEAFLVPSPAEIADALWENRSLLAENAWVTLREILLGIARRARRRRRASRSRCTSRRLLRDASYPLIVASQTIPIVVIAPILVVWFGFGIVAEGRHRRPDLLLPDHRQHPRRAALGRPRGGEDDAHASTPRAGRSSAGSRPRPRCPTSSPAPRSPSSSPRSAPSSPSGPAPAPGWPPDPSGQRQPRGRPACSPRSRPLGDRRSASDRPRPPRRAARRHLAIELTAMTRPRIPAIALAVALHRSPSASPPAARSPRTAAANAQPLQPDARLLPQPRPRRDLHGAEARLLRRSRARRHDRRPLRPGGADQAGRRRPHRPGDLLRARGGRSPTNRASTWSPSAALVNRPLTSLIWLKKSGIKGVADLKGKTSPPPASPTRTPS